MTTFAGEEYAGAATPQIRSLCPRGGRRRPPLHELSLPRL